MSRKLPKELKEAIARGRAKFLVPQLVEAQPPPDPFAAQRQLAREWIKASLPGIIEDYSAKGQNHWFVGSCVQGSVSRVPFLAEACEELGLTVLKNLLYSPKSEDKSDLEITELYTVIWEE